MLSLDKVFHTQLVLKNIIRETNVVRAYGIACTIKQIRPSVKVYGVQAAGAQSMYNAVRTTRKKRRSEH